jgi:hypothetical protein
MADGRAVKGGSIAAGGAVKCLSIAANRSLAKDLSIAASRSPRSRMLRGRAARRRTFVVVAGAALLELRKGQCRGREHQGSGNG